MGHGAVLRLRRGGRCRRLGQVTVVVEPRGSRPERLGRQLMDAEVPLDVGTKASRSAKNCRHDSGCRVDARCRYFTTPRATLVRGRSRTVHRSDRRGPATVTLRASGASAGVVAPALRQHVFEFALQRSTGKLQAAPSLESGPDDSRRLAAGQWLMPSPRACAEA